MDDLDCEGEVLEQTLKELKTINRWLGGNHVTTDGIQKINQCGTAKGPMEGSGYRLWRWGYVACHG